MTIDDPLDPLDELLSAYLDDEVTPDERARVEGDPELLAGVGRRREVRRRLNDVDIDDQERDANIAAALAAFDELRTAPAAPSPTDTATDTAPDELAARRAPGRRHIDRNRLIGWVGAAAAVGVAVFAMSRGTAQDVSDTASSDTEVPQAAEVAADQDSSKVAAAESAAAPDALGTVGDITGGAELAGDTTAAAADTTAAAMASTSAAPSEFSTSDELRAYVESEVRAGTLATAFADTGGGSVDDRFCTLPSGTPSIRVGPVVWQGQPAELVVSPDAAAPLKAVVLSADCTSIIATVELIR